MTRPAPTSPATPALPRPASTVAILRDGSDGVDVWLMRRHSRMAFAAGMQAFPGGAVEAADHDPSLPWSGDADASARAIGADARYVRALVSAAVRETFEECGVLLAAAASATEADRVALLTGGTRWPDLVRERGITLEGDLLVPWSRWITPEWSPRRFDAYFFLAALPDGPQPRWIDGEADEAAWVAARRAVAAFDAGQLPMLPPTIATLRDVAAHDSVASALDAAPSRILEETG